MKQLYNEPMSLHTTFKVGGCAAEYLIPESEDELISAVRSCRTSGSRYYVVGNGSNLIVSDDGFDGTIIEIGKCLGAMQLSGRCISASSGASLAAIAAFARDNSLTGFEFAAGIPGTLGGACIMNAGAYDGEMKQVLKSVRLYDPEQDEVILEGTDENGINLGYRYSNIPERGLIVLSAVIELAEGDREAISARMKELNQRRADKQPLDYPSAGSTFKRPAGYFAGKLIQDAGMQGYTVGGAQVSTKHAGFVINIGGATCSDIIRLTEDVSARVKAVFGVELEREVKILQ